MSNDKGSRGFGFVTFSDPRTAERVADHGPYHLDDRFVEAKPAQKPAVRNNKPHDPPSKSPGRKHQNHGNSDAAPVRRGGRPSNDKETTRQIFVGGLAAESTQEVLRTFFGRYGTVKDVKLPYDHKAQRPKGFGFVTFSTEEPAATLIALRHVQLGSKQVEIKAAQHKPKASANEGGLKPNPVKLAASANEGGSTQPDHGSRNAGAGSSMQWVAVHNYADPDIRLAIAVGDAAINVSVVGEGWVTVRIGTNTTAPFFGECSSSG